MNYFRQHIVSVRSNTWPFSLNSAKPILGIYSQIMRLSTKLGDDPVHDFKRPQMVTKNDVLLFPREWEVSSKIEGVEDTRAMPLYV